MLLRFSDHYAFSFYAFGLICGLHMLKKNTHHIHTWLFLYAFLEYAVSTRKVETMWIDTENTGSNWFYIHGAKRVSTFWNVDYGNTGYQNWKEFCLKINIPKGNEWILRIAVVASCPKLGIIFKNWFYQKIWI